MEQIFLFLQSLFLGQILSDKMKNVWKKLNKQAVAELGQAQYKID